MRLLCALGIAAVLALLPCAIDGGSASLQAKIVCGNFGDGFTCKNDYGPAAQFGKNAAPGAPQRPSEESPPAAAMPDGTWQGQTVPTESGQGGAAPGATGCQNGMVGTPPNCRCPKNSELLGGNCVHYTASACSSGMAPDALPQACRGVEEKVSCSLRQDGLKDCCCVTYDKF